MNPDSDILNLLQRGFITSAFQPIIALGGYEVAGYEALMRGPKGTLLASPGVVFGPRSPLSRKTLLQLDEACIAAALRGGHLLAPFAPIFINVDMQTLLQPRDRLSAYEKLIEASGVSPSRLVLEISERSTTDKPRLITRTLDFLRCHFGLKIALDDLGAAYSGLQHLLWFRPDFIKIDRAIVCGLHRSPQKRAVIRHLVAMARDLGCETIAEGVENQEDLIGLMDMSVPYAQGFRFGLPQGALAWQEKAVHPEGFRAWMEAGSRPSA